MTVRPERAVRYTLIACIFAAVSALADHSVVTNTAERRPMSSSSPTYPEKARNERREGDVTVCYTITAEGKVRRPYVHESSDRVFNRSAVRAAKEIVYEPAAPGAANTRAPACSTFRFRLQPLNEAATES